MSGLFKSAVLKPPTPEDISRRQYPWAETWNMWECRKGVARLDLDYNEGGVDFIWQIYESCGERITHWRWMDCPELMLNRWEYL